LVLFDSYIHERFLCFDAAQGSALLVCMKVSSRSNTVLSKNLHSLAGGQRR
jgi:hypothetical protein